MSSDAIETRLRDLGAFIRDQRRTARLSLRKLSEAAGISNPYLSQIERGLRKPSAEILQAIAKGLRISAETLYVRAGILDERDLAAPDVIDAVLGEPTLTDRQKQVLKLVLSRLVVGRPFAAPPGVPDDRKEALRTAFDATLKDPAFLDEAADQGAFAPVQTCLDAWIVADRDEAGLD